MYIKAYYIKAEKGCGEAEERALRRRLTGLHNYLIQLSEKHYVTNII